MLKLYRYLKPFRHLVYGVFILIFLQTLGDLYLPTLMSDIINDGVMNGDTQKILHIGGVMLLVAGVAAVFSILASFLSAKAAVGLGTVLRSKLFGRIESFSLHEFDKIGTATLITRTTNDINQVQTVTIMIMRMMISAPIMAIGGIILAYREDKALTWVFAVAIPVLAIVIVMIASKMIPLFRLVQGKIDRINLVLREKLTGVRVIRAFNTIEHEKKRFDAANVDLTDNYIKVNKIMAFMMPTIMLIMNLTSLAILWFGGIRISIGDMDLGALSAFTQYAMQIMMSMLMLAMMFIMVPRSQAAAVRINEVLETVPEIEDAKDLKDTFTGKGYVEFKDVTFSYHGAEEPAIRDISFAARPGEFTAIIGSTGSGKSTLINLIPRFYDVDSGSVLIDGVDVRDISQENLRQKIGFVPQKAVLFSGTIAENIQFGGKQATEEEIQHAAEVAQAAEFITKMDGGYDHVIAQGGTNVSGGQKQRLAIARALVRKPEIYIFDDSFSALDFKTDARLRAALKQEIAEATVLIIAQRVGTVMDADRIIVLDNGQIAGIGTHKELLNSCEVYREIVSSQLSEEEIA
ncbi:MULTISPECIES: ABC transporter ATP-binding protein [Dehalobacter]|jgi:ATP-binding cassette subfamily B protein|uniref:Multidrug ABC transporter ATP-binding protein n=1 Tax=Dehalobacter restrictus (strain DSM 9455 / PER-K23) TaxID=871738 RepID=A0ABM5P8H4_DEHRP|nr:MULTISPECIES: ABC transporter ATP-binding protein [Dehalobacter]AHF10990.1 multidrug ABC transporter ATP-binding protein [Dehalobacter restrictus DSM 9455]MCG1024757.1 ABC transporter ATP-binding protein [Dehalobacter sp.]MDJ0307064.1 ABC transporter ATP-binding protein [Dehalobacter sp.]OCZ49603.1 multidrug ABC transporter ATP-binding protein [Dehalobacter sp. TeCB1]